MSWAPRVIAIQVHFLELFWYSLAVRSWSIGPSWRAPRGTRCRSAAGPVTRPAPPCQGTPRRALDPVSSQSSSSCHASSSEIEITSNNKSNSQNGHEEFYIEFSTWEKQ